MYRALWDVTPHVLGVSCDEAYIEVGPALPLRFSPCLSLCLSPSLRLSVYLSLCLSVSHSASRRAVAM